MKFLKLAAGAALAAAALPAIASADDPKDPRMQTREARERDAAIIRQLNRDQLAFVRERDARWAKERRERDASNASSAAEYEQQMAQWRRAVRLCREGDYRYCAR